ncbi:N-6 DNA methylase [Lentzea sp. NPDC058436]|uniref:class I SAM-dependent DNA methyltransferase n=1 Tax=Lentzea sp. NPDC058436 TaxID=3346499 RepID=UPI00366954C3
METTTDAVRRLWALCNVLRDDGITYHEYLGELTYLLFLKLANELDIERDVPSQFRWDALRSQPESVILERYQDALRALGVSSNPKLARIFEDSRTAIRSGHSLRRLIEGIASIDWYRGGQNGIGDIYEGLIEKNATESRYGAGQYFTPRALVEALVSVSRPQGSDVIYDPAVGTAGFLVAAGLQSAGRSRHEPKLVGQELVRDVQRMALMNLQLHGLEGDIRVGDTLSANPADVGASLCITNPPFGVKGGLTSQQMDLLDFPTSNKQLAFIQHVYKSLIPNGRAVVVVPDNVLFESGVAAALRTHLLDNFDLHTILRLPAGIFYATGVRTSVLFFARTGPSQSTWVYDLRNGVAGFTKRRQLNHSDLVDFTDAYGADPLGRASRNENDRFRMLSRADLRDSGDRLDFDAMLQRSTSPTGTPTEMSEMIVQELQQALASAQDLARLLRESEEVANG